MEVKVCYKCKLSKSIDEFAINKKRPDGLNSQCKSCHKEYRRQHYLNNKQKYINKASEYRKSFWKWFKELKQTFKCKQCGEDRWWVLDFHHKNPKDKDEEVSKIVRHCNKKRVLNEINKCDILCANCHRDLHYQESSSGINGNI